MRLILGFRMERLNLSDRGVGLKNRRAKHKVIILICSCYDNKKNDFY